MRVSDKAANYALHTDTFKEVCDRTEDLIYVAERDAFVKGAEYIYQEVDKRFQGDESARSVLNHIVNLLSEYEGN
jgi:hypothetical protein